MTSDDNLERSEAGKGSEAGKFQASEVIQLNFELDAAQKKAIQRCLDRGKHRVTMSKLDFTSGDRFTGAYEWD